MAIRIRHRVIHYIKQFLLMCIIWGPNLYQSEEFIPVWTLLVIDSLVLVYVIIVHFNDYLFLTDGSLGGNTFQFWPRIGLITLSVPRFRVRSCKLKRFLLWNTITIEGPVGIIYVMHNMAHAKRFVNEFNRGWDNTSQSLQFIGQSMP